MVGAATLAARRVTKSKRMPGPQSGYPGQGGPQNR